MSCVGLALLDQEDGGDSEPLSEPSWNLKNRAHTFCVLHCPALPPTVQNPANVQTPLQCAHGPKSGTHRIPFEDEGGVKSVILTPYSI